MVPGDGGEVSRASDLVQPSRGPSGCPTRGPGGQGLSDALGAKASSQEQPSTGHVSSLVPASARHTDGINGSARADPEGGPFYPSWGRRRWADINRPETPYFQGGAEEKGCLPETAEQQ